MSLGIFESLAADDSDERVAQRKAAAVANKRVNDRFGAFLAAAKESSERAARLNLVRGDIQEVIASACSEYGGDPKSIETSILSRLATHEGGMEHLAPGDQHLPGASPKRNRQYEHIKEACIKDGKSEDECKELAARTVNKQRSEHGETKSKVANTPASQRWGTEPIDDLPWWMNGRFMRENDDYEQTGIPTGPDGPDVVGEPKSINLEPNWEGMQAWLDNVAQTDPEVAQGIAEASGGKLTVDPYAKPGGPLEDPEAYDVPQDDFPPHDQTSYSNVRTARRPKMCPYHREVTDISLASGDPSAGFNAMAQHAWGPNHCQGEFDGRCNWSREMVTQEYWDQKAQQAQERREQRERERAIEQEVQETEVPESPEGLDSTEPATDPGDGPSIMDELAEAPSAVGTGEEVSTEPTQTLEPMAASTRTSEEDASGVAHCDRCGREMTFDAGGDEELCSQCKKALSSESRTAEAPRDGGGAVKTVDVDAGSSEDPSPEMDKTKWDPQDRGAAGEPIDTEQENSPHPTDRIDPLVPVAPQNHEPDFLDGTDAVTEKQDVTQEGGPNLSDADSGSWAGNNGASPVTSSSASVDPDANPIQRIVEEDFLTPSQVESAIKDYQNARAE